MKLHCLNRSDRPKVVVVRKGEAHRIPVDRKGVVLDVQDADRKLFDLATRRWVQRSELVVTEVRETAEGKPGKTSKKGKPGMADEAADRAALPGNDVAQVSSEPKGK